MLHANDITPLLPSNSVVQQIYVCLLEIKLLFLILLRSFRTIKLYDGFYVISVTHYYVNYNLKLVLSNLSRKLPRDRTKYSFQHFCTYLLVDEVKVTYNLKPSLDIYM